MPPQYSQDFIARRREVVKEAFEKFPDAPHRTLARMIHEAHPMLFEDVENARKAVRHHSGQTGGNSSKTAKREGRYRPPRKPGELPPLPKSKVKPWLPYILKGRRVLVLSDVHFIAQEDAALEAAMAYGDKFKPDVILANGDLVDFLWLSTFLKDPNRPPMSEELEACTNFWAHVKKRYPKAKRIWKFGNHEERFDKYCIRNAPVLFELPMLQEVWYPAAGIPQNKVEVVKDQRPIYAGKLMILHGHEKGRGISSPVNPARGAFLRLLSPVLEGHGHRQSEHTERNAEGMIIACRTAGCLCTLSPEHDRFSKWNHGFATVEVSSNGDYHVELIRIINGKCY